MHRFEKINNLSTNIIELNLYQDQNKWEHNSIPIETSKNGESNCRPINLENSICFH